MILTAYDYAVIKKAYNEMRLNNSKSDAYLDAVKDLELLIKRLKRRERFSR